MEKKKNNQVVFGLLVMVGAIAGGLVPTANALGLNAGLTDAQVLIGQSSLGLIAMLLLFFVTGKFKNYPLKSFFSSLFIGIFLGLTGFFLVKALSELEASVTVILQFQFTWIGILLDAVYTKQKLTTQKIILIAVILLGVVLGSGVFETGVGAISIKGIIFGLLNATCYALYIFFNDAVEPELHWLKKGTGIATGVLVVVILTSLPQLSTIGNVNISDFLLYGGISAIVAIILPITCFSIGIPKIGAGLSSLLSSVELPAAILGTLIFLGEKISFLRFIGMLVILGAILYSNLSEQKKNLP